MEQKVGISLCTGGSAVRIIGSRLCRFGKGTVTILSPALPSVDVSRSDDFSEVRVLEKMDLIAGETAPFLSQVMPVMNKSVPLTVLSDEWTSHILSRIGMIEKRENMEVESELFRKMNLRIVSLQRVELILEVMYELANGVRPQGGERPSRGEQVFVSFMQSLGKNFASRKQVSEYADEAHLTVRHFSTLVRQYTGQTPMQWIHTFTISRAKHLLRQSDLQVKEVADELGFPDQFSLRRYFKTHTGLSPTAFRETSSTLPEKGF